jgi:CRP-like cAMP-binding protein
MTESISITANIFKDMSFTEGEIALIDSKFEKTLVKRGETILEANENVMYQYYVFSGCLRTFFIDRNGKEHTIQFGIQDWWVSDYMAFFAQEKSLLNIECIQEAVLYKISKQSIDEIYDAIPKVDRFFRIKMEKSFASFQKRILSNLSQTAKERYLSFVEQYPNIEQKIKNYHIASFLGVTTESLSRIRKELAE